MCKSSPIVDSVRRDKIVIQGATDLLQQPQLCDMSNKLFTLHFV